MKLRIIKWLFWLSISLIIFIAWRHYWNWDNGYCWRCHYGKPFSEYMMEWMNYDIGDSFLIWIVMILIFLLTYFIVRFFNKLYLKNRKV